jgi:DNA polymerase-4
MSTDLVEPLSWWGLFRRDTKQKKSSASLWRKKSERIFFNEVGLTASAGISINKFVAKIASDYNKQMARKLLIRWSYFFSGGVTYS